MFRQLGRFIVAVLDDHDMSSRARKERFAAHGTAPAVYQQTAHAVGVQLTTPGIPAIYYGTEQAFDGTEAYHDYSIESKRFAEDRYVREAMFGGGFGAYGTEGCHFFNPNHPTYLRISAIAAIRNRPDFIGKALRRGRFYPRETSYLGYPFSIPKRGELIAWSQMLYNTEVLMALNTNPLEERGAEVTVDAYLNPPGSTMKFLYRGDWSDEQLLNPPDDQMVEITYNSEGRATVSLKLPPAGMAILA
jgi:glycosidase